MLGTPQKLVVLAAGGVMILMALAVAYVALPPPPGEEVPVPPSSAGPEEVVSAYLRALDAHDCETAEAVMTAAAREVATAWCADVARVDRVQVGSVRNEPPQAAGRAPGRDVVSVPVTFDVDWRFLHGDASLPEGSTTWGYTLVRRGPDEPWRIFDQGVG